jgi:hypothetical protein
MRDLTIHELDSELAEQLPTRELMGGYCYGGHPSASSTHQTNVANVGNSSQSNSGISGVQVQANNNQIALLGQNFGPSVNQGNFSR